MTPGRELYNQNAELTTMYKKKLFSLHFILQLLKLKKLISKIINLIQNQHKFYKKINVT